LISLSGGREMFRLMVNLQDPADMLSKILIYLQALQQT
jgi:hypothetical protein